MANESNKVSDNILIFLKKKHSASTTEIANYFSVTSMAVRQHLHIHLQNNLVNFEDKPADRGRPKRMWYLTAKAESLFEQDSDLFFNLALKHLAKSELKSLAMKIYRDYTKKLLGSSEIAKLPLEKLKTVLNQHLLDAGYLFELSLSKKKLSLSLFHCPHWNAIKNFEEFITKEKKWIHTLLKNYQVDTIAFNHQGNYHAVYLISDII